MAYTNKDGIVVSSRTIAVKETKAKKKSIVGKSFYFLGPRKWNYPLYIGYIIKDMGEEIKVWLLRRNTGENRECIIRKNIIIYDPKNDCQEERKYYNSTNISGEKVQDKEK